MTNDNVTEIEAAFKDFDAVEREEVTSQPVEFQLAGERWSANLNVNAGYMLRWMRSGSRVEAIPQLLIALLGEKQYEKLEEALIESGYPMAVMEEVILWLAEQMGSDSGN